MQNDNDTCMHAKSLQLYLFVTLWTVVPQAPLPMEFSRQDYWSDLPCPPPGDLPYPGIELVSFTFLALASGFFIPLVPPEKPKIMTVHIY